MAARKRKESAASSTPARNGSTVALAVATFLLAGLMAGGYLAWQKWGRVSLNQEHYRLAPQNVEIPPLPPWIKTDVKAEVFHDDRLAQASILEPDLTLRISSAFESHPWIAKVHRAMKRPPATVTLELEYRRPVAWVEVPRGMFPGSGAGVLPIDQSAVLLPQGDFSEEQLDQFLRIAVDDIQLGGPTGAVWGDARVAGAARIAAILLNDWRELGLYRIRAVPEYSGRDMRPGTRYEIYTRQDKRLIWGNAPGEEALHEPAGTQKLQILREYTQRHGIVDNTAAIGLDLRDPNSVLGPRTAQQGEQSDSTR